MLSCRMKFNLPYQYIFIAIYYKYYIMGCLLSNTIIWSIVTLITRTANPSWKWGGRLTAGRIGRQNRTPNCKAKIYLNFSKKYLIIPVKQWLFDLSICSNLKKCNYFTLFRGNLLFKTIFANFTFHQMEVIFEPNSTCLRTKKKEAALCSSHSSALSLLSHLNNSLLLTPQKAEVRPQKTAFSWTWNSFIVTFESPVFECSSDLTKKNNNCVCFIT